MKKTTVVIPNYNGMQYLEACLQSLFAQKGSFDILVVDNGSADGSECLVEKLQTGEERPWAGNIGLSQIRLEKNTGFCGAVNVGMEAAKTPYVLLLNNDTVVLDGFVERLEQCIEQDARRFSVGAKMLSLKEPQQIDDAGDFYSVLGWAFARGKGKHTGKYQRPGAVFAACGGAAIYRRELVTSLGGFDENHFAYLEDIDLAYRARIYGYQNFFEPGAEVLHAGSATTGSRHNAFKVRLAARNSVYLAWKNMPLVQWVCNLPFLCLGCVIKYIYFCRKHLGKEYWQGVREGVHLCQSVEGKAHKVTFLGKHVGNYIRLQVELWWNCLVAILG